MKKVFTMQPARVRLDEAAEVVELLLGLESQRQRAALLLPVGQSACAQWGVEVDTK